MSEINSAANLPAPVERRSRWNPFAVQPRVAKHKRTPETWANMVDELAAANAAKAQMQRERDQAVSERDALRRDVYGLRQRMGSLETEVRQMRALMGADPTDPANQTTHSFVMPERPVDDSDPAEVVTQPISQAELFAEDPMKPLRPVIRIHEFPTASMSKPMDTIVSEAVPSTMPTDPVQQMFHRLSMQNPEGVQEATEERVLALWDVPPAQRGPKSRRTA